MIADESKFGIYLAHILELACLDWGVLMCSSGGLSHWEHIYLSRAFTTGQRNVLYFLWAALLHLRTRSACSAQIWESIIETTHDFPQWLRPRFHISWYKLWWKREKIHVETVVPEVFSKERWPGFRALERIYDPIPRLYRLSPKKTCQDLVGVFFPPIWKRWVKLDIFSIWGWKKKRFETTSTWLTHTSTA